MNIYKAIAIGSCCFICIILLFGCKSSPWGESPESCRSEQFSISSNLALLKVKERQIQDNEGPTEFKVALIADSHRHVEDLDRLIERINDRSDELEFILFLGDLTDAGLEMEYDWVCKSLKKSHLPIFPVIGNHDLLNFGEEIWRNIFGPLNYSFTFLGSKFILFKPDKLDYSDPQDLSFVRNETERDTGETRYHTIAVSHVPPSDSTIYKEAEREEMRDVFMNSGIHLSIHGHRHYFSFSYDPDRELYEYIIDQVEDERYGVLTITRDAFSFENCFGQSCDRAMVQ